MRNRTALPVGGSGAGLGRLVVLAVAAIGAGCATGGGGRAVMTQAEIDAMLVVYAGNWVLDESGSSPKTSVPRVEDRTVTAVVSSQDLERFRRELEAEQRTSVIRAATFEVLARRPSALVLGAEGAQLVYHPTPGARMTLPLDGGSIAQPGGEQSVRTRVVWDGPRLGLEHMVGSEGQVREVLEVVDGRLRMTRTIRIFGETVAPLVLWYDREGAG